MITTLKLQQSVLPSPSLTLSTNLFNQPHLIASNDSTLHVLNESAQTLISSISFQDAFPLSSTDQTHSSISSIAVDQDSNRIVASLGTRLAVFEPNLSTKELGKWRVHSGFSINLHHAVAGETGIGEIQAVDYVKGLIAVAAKGIVAVYRLQEEFGLPKWNQIAILPPFEFSISQIKLHPLSNLLAILPEGACTSIIYELVPSPSSSPSSNPPFEFTLKYRSKVNHSNRISSISWRLPFASSISDSGPILMTRTIHQTNHLWGCVIDEPLHFSLLTTLPNPLPLTLTNTNTNTNTQKKVIAPVEQLRVATNTRLPLSPLDPNRFKEKHEGEKLGRDRTVWSGFWRTRKREEQVDDKGKGKGKGGTQDLWISLKEDGKFSLTIISNLDSRPPTCLTQITIPLSTTHSSTRVQQQDLAYFRNTSLLTSRSQPDSTIHLIARGSWNGLKHYQLEIPSSSLLLLSNSTSPSTATTTIIGDSFRLKTTTPSISFVGHIRKFIKPFPTAESLLLLGTPRNSSSVGLGRIQTFSSPSRDVEEGLPMQGDEETVMDLDGFGDESESGGKKKRVAFWKQGRMVVVGEGNRLSVYSRESKKGMKLRVRKEMRVSMEDAKMFLVVRRTEDDGNTWVVAVTKKKKRKGEGEGKEYEVNTWVYHAKSNEIFEGARTRSLGGTSDEGGEGVSVVWVSVVPFREEGRDSVDQIELQSIDTLGRVRNWRLGLGEEEPEWRERGGEGFRTGRTEVKRCSSKGKGVIAVATDQELTIWNEKNGKFGNSLEFSYPLTEPPVSLEFSNDTNLLAFASRSQVLIFATQRRSLTSSRWTLIATITPPTPSPITNLQFHLSGLAIACESQLFFHSFDLLKNRTNKRGVPVELTRGVEVELEEKGGAFGVLRSEQLEMALTFGHFETVRKVFVEVAKELDEDGKALVRVTPSDRGSVLKVDGFLEEMRKEDSSEVEEKKIKGDVLSALSSEGNRQARSALIAESEGKLSESNRDRLVNGLTKVDMLRKLSKDEHTRLSVLVKAVYETQSKQSSVDSNGLRYLLALRSLVNSNPKALSLSASSAVDSPRLSSRDMLFAYYSKNQQVLLDESIEAVGAGGKLSWENAKCLGIPLWLRDRDSLIRTMELIGRTSFLLDPENRDPILPMLFYLSLRKLPQVYTFWKQSIGHSDQRQMLKFLANDFDTERWRSAARKNAFALLSKRRFLFAAAFFLLGDSLFDCTSVILRHLGDPLLAIAIARTYENGDEGPVLKELIEKTMLKESLGKGDRFLSCWSFEMLGKKEMAMRVMVDSLPSLASQLGEYGFTSIVNPPVEDPARIVFVRHLMERSKKREQVKNESEFVLYIARQLSESGCQLVALDLLRSYRFPPPTRPQSVSLAKPTSPAIPTQFVEPDLSSLFDMSTPKPPPSKPLAPATVTERDTKEKDEEEEEAKEREKRLFREATGAKPKIETKATVDAFSFDAFGF